jgi:hypothetical protein
VDERQQFGGAAPFKTGSQQATERGRSKRKARGGEKKQSYKENTPAGSGVSAVRRGNKEKSESAEKWDGGRTTVCGRGCNCKSGGKPPHSMSAETDDAENIEETGEKKNAGGAQSLCDTPG